MIQPILKDPLPISIMNVFHCAHVGSTITGPTDGVDRVDFSVWIFLHANTVLDFEKHNLSTNEGLHLALNPVIVKRLLLRSTIL